MLLVVMSLGSLTTGIAEEELLDLPVVGLYLKMGVEFSVLFAQLRVYRTLGDRVSCIVLAL